MDNEVTKTETLPPVPKTNDSFLLRWAHSNEDKFSKVMDALFKEDPRKFAEIYVKICKEDSVGRPKSIKQTNNITHKTTMHVNKLDAASEIKDSSWRDKNEFTAFEVFQ